MSEVGKPTAQSSKWSLVKDWLPIVISVLALGVSAFVAWDQRRAGRADLNLRVIAGSTVKGGCPEVTLFVTNESSNAITIAPPFVADLRPQPKRGPLWFLKPGPLVVSLTPTVGPRSRRPIFLRPKEAAEFRHVLTGSERRQLRKDSRLVAAVTDYVGHFWSESFEEQNPTKTSLEILRQRCVG